jgi:hydroxymethylpyrimidine/phosphomethylpyrimidine kinase
MLGNADIVRAVAAALRGHPGIPLVVDPVMISTSGHALLEADAVAALREELMPRATIVTPNMPEAAALTGRPVATAEEIRQAAEAVAARLPGVAVLVKGGHRADNSADDLLRTADGEMVQFRGERVDTRNTHGTGCTLSAAIACGLAEGWELAWAVQSAKEYLSGALRHDPHLGHGNGPLDHQWKMHG